ncbi:MAG: PIN domain-containing protein [Rubrivivax sp.]|nr:MAG: PIN domain-containing protein [Rubrivivax sp.]
MKDSVGLDTNVLARYFVDDDGDAATQRQRDAARRLMESGRPLAVAKTVLLEFEWVLRGHYELGRGDVAAAMQHLLDLPHVRIEDRERVVVAVALLRDGFDFADALHHASYQDCSSMASFDDRRFARRAQARALVPRVVVPS